MATVLKNAFPPTVNAEINEVTKIPASNAFMLSAIIKYVVKLAPKPPTYYTTNISYNIITNTRNFRAIFN